MSKTMVLGGGGWLGSQLVKRLVLQGREVLCIDLFVGAALRALPGVQVIEADIRAMDKYALRLSECSVVFNCAGLLHPKQTSEIYKVNRDAPVALYQACVARGVATFVHISSINAQGQNESPTNFFDETSTPHPTTHYGVSKLEGDRHLMAIAGGQKTRLIILRPGVFYGANPSKNLCEFMEKLKTSTMPIFSRRGYVRTYVDVEKVVDALLLGEHNGCSGQAYLVGDVEPLSTQRFYEIIADELGTTPRIIQLPGVIAHLCEHLAFLAGKMNFHLRVPTIVGEFGRNIFCSVDKAKQDLGLVPHSSSEDGLRRMARAFQNGAALS